MQEQSRQILLSGLKLFYQRSRLGEGFLFDNPRWIFYNETSVKEMRKQ